MENNKKKTLVLSILGVLLLILAVVGVSFAMYSFAGLGTTENIIRTGTVSVSYNENNKINLTNQYPMSDELGLAQTGTNSVLSFTVSASMSGTMTINYDLGFDAITPSADLTAADIRFALYKDDSLLTLKTGDTPTIDTIAGRASVAAPNSAATGITSNGLDGGTFTSNGQSYNYVLKAWVKSDYELPNQTVENEDVYSCSDTKYTTQTSCETNGGTWSVTGVKHSNQTTSDTFTFKVKVVAVQA